MQRMENDTLTMDKRERADNLLKENRNKNDKLTLARREKADRTMDESRLRNDELTTERRETKDGDINMVIVLSFLALTVLIVGAYFIFV